MASIGVMCPALQRFFYRFIKDSLCIARIIPIVWHCLVCLLSCPLLVMSAPAPSGSSFWMNPCGIEFRDGDNTVMPVPVRELYEEIIVNANVSHLQSKEVKRYMLETFSINEDSLQNRKYDWLESPIADVEQFKRLNRDEAIKDTYYLLQKFAVALNQMVKDQADRQKYHEFLEDSRLKTIQLLCSLQMSMLSLNIHPHPDATPDVMDPEFSTSGEATKLIRDFMVIRDYSKATLYTRELLNFFRITQ